MDGRKSAYPVTPGLRIPETKWNGYKNRKKAKEREISHHKLLLLKCPAICSSVVFGSARDPCLARYTTYLISRVYTINSVYLQGYCRDTKISKLSITILEHRPRLKDRDLFRKRTRYKILRRTVSSRWATWDTWCNKCTEKGAEPRALVAPCWHIIILLTFSHTRPISQIHDHTNIDENPVTRNSKKTRPYGNQQIAKEKEQVWKKNKYKEKKAGAPLLTI